MPSFQRRVAAKMRHLLAANPRIKRDEALRQYAHLAVQQAVLEQAMLDGKTDDRRLRALSEVSRMLIDLGSRIGLVPSAPRAGTEAPTEHSYEDYLRR